MGVGRIEFIKTTLEVSIQTMLQVSMGTILKHSMKIKFPIFYLISNFDFIYTTGPRVVTLVGGGGPWEGNVMVDGEPVCDDGWSRAAGEVVCRQLNFSGLDRITTNSR